MRIDFHARNLRATNNYLPQYWGRRWGSGLGYRNFLQQCFRILFESEGATVPQISLRIHGCSHPLRLSLDGHCRLCIFSPEMIDQRRIGTKLFQRCVGLALSLHRPQIFHSLGGMSHRHNKAVRFFDHSRLILELSLVNKVSHDLLHRVSLCVFNLSYLIYRYKVKIFYFT